MVTNECQRVRAMENNATKTWDREQGGEAIDIGGKIDEEGGSVRIRRGTLRERSWRNCLR